MNVNKTILGFDVSSTTVGWSIINIMDDDSLQYVVSGYLKPSKKGTIFDRLNDLKTKAQSIISQYKPTNIALEEIISYMPGKSSAKTIITLAVFNRTLGMAAFEYLGASPALLNVMSIRHGLKKNKDLPSKDQMPELVANHLNIDFPYQYNRKNEIKTESYDEADGIAVALYYALKLSNNLPKKIKTKKKTPAI